MGVVHATLHNGYGWSIVRVEDGTANVVANVGHDQDLAELLRDWLDHRDRIAVLLDRHGLVDVPLDAL